MIVIIGRASSILLLPTMNLSLGFTTLSSFILKVASSSIYIPNIKNDIHHHHYHHHHIEGSIINSILNTYNSREGHTKVTYNVTYVMSLATIISVMMGVAGIQYEELKKIQRSF